MARIDIHRALDGGAAEQFLLDFDVGTHMTQQARVGMAKRLPANLADPCAAQIFIRGLND